MFYSVREKREAEIRKELREMAQDPEIQKEQLAQSRERSDYTNAKKAEQERQNQEAKQYVIFVSKYYWLYSFWSSLYFFLM